MWIFIHKFSPKPNKTLKEPFVNRTQIDQLLKIQEGEILFYFLKKSLIFSTPNFSQKLIIDSEPFHFFPSNKQGQENPFTVKQRKKEQKQIKIVISLVKENPPFSTFKF